MTTLARASLSSLLYIYGFIYEIQVVFIDDDGRGRLFNGSDGKEIESSVDVRAGGRCVCVSPLQVSWTLQTRTFYRPASRMHRLPPRQVRLDMTLTDDSTERYDLLLYCNELRFVVR